jgi:hypothetical protein
MGIASDDYSACETYERHEEETRVERWWRTYDAAITGGHAFPGLAGAMAPLTVEQCHENATKAANLAHGELPK